MTRRTSRRYSPQVRCLPSVLLSDIDISIDFPFSYRFFPLSSVIWTVLKITGAFGICIIITTVFCYVRWSRKHSGRRRKQLEGCSEVREGRLGGKPLRSTSIHAPTNARTLYPTLQAPLCASRTASMHALPAFTHHLVRRQCRM